MDFIKKIILSLICCALIVSCSSSTENNSTDEHPVSSNVPEQVEETPVEKTPVEKTSLIKQSDVKDLMGTYVGVDLCVAPDQHDDYIAAMEELWAVLGEIHWRMSKYSDKGDVYNINHAQPDEMVAVKEDTYHVLSEAQRFNKLSEGAFDITVEPLIEFWKKKVMRSEFPLSREIEKVKEAVGMDKLLLEEGRVKRLSEDVLVDLGGIAKGFAIDEAVRILHIHGFRHFLVDAGGDVYVGGMNCEGKAWHIGVRDPHNPTGLHSVVQVSNTAVTTSGDYEQFFTIKGRKLSHIINPITGYPQKGVISATVIAPTALEADALSTSLAVLGAQKGIPMIDQLGEGYAGMILYESTAGQPLEVFESAAYAKYKFEK